MEQPKVFEFAKEIGMETLALMDKIREWKLPVKSHMAFLDESLMTEIRTRLAAEQEAAAPAKKKAVRKTVATTKKAAEAKPEAEAKKVEAKPAVKKAEAPVTKSAAKKAAPKKAPAVKKASSVEAEAPAKATAKSSSAKKGPGVIRRKAGELEERAKALAEQEAIAQAVAAQNREAAEDEKITGETTPAEGPGVAALSASPAATGTTEEPRRTRGNIIGRMDLRRVVTPGGANREGGFQGGGQQGQFGARPSRTAPRGIRPGFVAPMPMVEMPREETDQERIQREEKEKKKRTPTREEEQVFTATEFRKREVIFQPKKKKPMTGRDAKKTQITTPKASKRVVKVDNTIKVGDLAAAMNVKAPLLIKKLMTDGVMATITTDLDFDTVSLITPEFGFEAVNTHRTAAELMKDIASGDLTAEKVLRPPVVTVMGHVDHGKTTLLDAIRNADVAKGEAGGITQHIGAYTVSLENDVKTTFIDTPGHEAFTAMRARGANVTDIAVIVVAADDGMMPQTAEAINHAKAANVPIIVAINKMDRPGANPERIKQQLTEFELVPEEWGGTTIYCPVSALKKEGIKELLEQIHLVAEVQELKANPKRSATGVVIESRMEKGRGAVATLLVKDGTLRVGDDFVAGAVIGRVRSMMNDQGVIVKEVSPGYAVEVMGLPAPPQAGDYFDVAQDEEMAKRLAEQRKVKATSDQPNSKMTLDQLFAKVKTGDQKELSFILKADVGGSLEAVKGMIDKAGTTEVKPKLIHSAIGGITESDILLASTAKGMVIGFNVRPDGEAQRMAKEKGVEIKTYSIIYELIDDLKKMMSGMLDPIFKEKQTGRAEVRNTFVVPKIGTIAGSFVVDGKITRGNQLRLVRDGRIIYEGKLSSLKRFKDDAKEVASGFECGIGIENFNDIKVGDIIEAFVMEQVVRDA
ncbi:MAG: translation initiation factor IF-2 [Bdellovibrionales bacterium]